MFALCAPPQKEAVAGMCDWAGIEEIPRDGGIRPLANALRRLQPDLYLCPQHIVEPSDPHCVTVSLIPDLQHEACPELFAAEELANRRRSYAAAVHRADLVLTPSAYARSTILQRYPEADAERVIAAYPGVDPAFRADAWRERGDYLLYPANFWPHKNHARLMEALERLRQFGLAPPVVLTGDPGSGYQRVAAQIDSRGLERQVRFLGRLPLEDFVPLLRGARALAYPSLYEGFGLPIVEAFHCDTPVLCSRVASCPEVAGNAAMFVDPTDAASLASGLRRIWGDAGLRARLVKNGRRRREELDWNASLEHIRVALMWAFENPRRSPPLRALVRALGRS